MRTHSLCYFFALAFAAGTIHAEHTKVHQSKYIADKGYFPDSDEGTLPQLTDPNSTDDSNKQAAPGTTGPSQKPGTSVPQPQIPKGSGPEPMQPQADKGYFPPNQ